MCPAGHTLQFCHWALHLTQNSNGMSSFSSLNTQKHFLDLLALQVVKMYDYGGVSDDSLSLLAASCPALSKFCIPSCYSISDYGISTCVKRCRPALLNPLNLSSPNPSSPSSPTTCKAAGHCCLIHTGRPHDLKRDEETA